MPRKINMIISNGNNFFPQQIRPQLQQIRPQLQQVRPQPQPQPQPENKPDVPLNSGMITRIHNVRPGCGSCGRKAS
jgi:hypothetical protein